VCYSPVAANQLEEFSNICHVVFGESEYQMRSLVKLLPSVQDSQNLHTDPSKAELVRLNTRGQCIPRDGSWSTVVELVSVKEHIASHIWV
jgi:hypothetical protein